jgi:cytochrome c-type biogenesis protein CcmH/NrfF
VRRATLTATAVTAAALLAASAALFAAAPALAVTQRTSFIAIEQQVMCVTCGIPLAEADSVAAQQEKAYIQQLVGAGETEAQVKNRLVAQYGSGVLALPPDSGFNVAFYVVPIAVVLAALAIVALLLPRWRRNRLAAAGAAAGGADAGALSASDSERLDADLARFDPR